MTKRTDRFKRKKLAYDRTFCGDKEHPHEDAKIVLADLKRFCGINRGGIVISPVSRVVDPYATVYQAGQRDVFLRISQFLGLDETEISETIEESNHVETQTGTSES